MPTTHLRPPSEHDLAQVVATARAAVGASEDSPARWRAVTRLERDRDDYVLVAVTTPHATWVVALGLDGEVLAQAQHVGDEPWWARIEDDLVWGGAGVSPTVLHPVRRDDLPHAVRGNRAGTPVPRQPSRAHPPGDVRP